MPFLGVNLAQRVRSGDGKFDFEEDLVFDITKKTDFDNSWTKINGLGSQNYAYNVLPGPVKEQNNNIVDVISVPLNGTIDGYGVTSAIPKIGSVPIVDPTDNYLVQFLLNLTKADILKLDITRIDIYIDIQGVAFNTLKMTLLDKSDSHDALGGTTVSVGNLTKIKVEVFDILEINNFVAGENIIFSFATPLGEIIPSGSFVVFDVQFYSIPEITTPSLTKVSLWISATALTVIFLGFIVSPEISFEGILNRMGNAMTRGN
ncbi:MAG: hypothetical protein E3J52_10360 [Promethearchaeota archaeon]|nr:MAG: hypothetical protein E3J52_10360 [Candidatus Lokiarchaeota archaeon]